MATDAVGRQVVQQPNNALFGTTAVSVTTTAVSTSSTAAANGQCVVVTVGNIAATAQFAANASVRVRNTTTAITTGWQSAGLLFVGQIATLYFNLPVTNGDTVVVDIIAPATITATKTTIAAVLSPLTIPTPLRPDGRSLPLGSQVFYAAQEAAGTPSLVGTPGAGFRILMGASFLFGGSATTGPLTVTLSATINGTAGVVNVVQSPTASIGPPSVVAPPAGVLCDPNTAVTANISAFTGGVQVYDWCMVFYDIVPL
jgi:hypothetical protein